MEGTHLDENYFTESVKKLPEDMSAKVMTLYDQLVLKEKQRGIAEGMEKAVQKTVLNAFDAGIPLATIRIITGENEEKITRILLQNQRVP